MAEDAIICCLQLGCRLLLSAFESAVCSPAIEGKQKRITEGVHFMSVLLFIDGNRGGLRTRDTGMYLMITLGWRLVAHKLRFVEKPYNFHLLSS